MNALRRLGEAVLLVGLLAFVLAWLLSCYGRVVTPLFWAGGIAAVVGFILCHTFQAEPPPPPPVPPTAPTKGPPP